MIKSYFPDREFAAFLFDFDGTIADTMNAHHEAWNKALSVYGLSLSVQQHLDWAGRPTREIVKLLNELHKTEMSPDEVSKNKEDHYLLSLANVKEIIPVVDIIKTSHGKTPMAIVSGGRHKSVDLTLEKLGLAKYFEAIVCAEDYVQGKPAPDCFLKAASLLDVDPKGCLVFEDAKLGIEAARAAGMACLRVSPHPDHGHAITKEHS